jgi:LysR family hydrogen peroxide-inducible transcriptional activator
MELHQLRCLCAIVDSGSVSRAAQQTRVSRPSLSQQIRRLEDELGARLFDRLGCAVRLTEFERTFRPRARSVLRELDAARSDAVERRASISGARSVGVIPAVAPYLRPQAKPSRSAAIGAVASVPEYFR